MAEQTPDLREQIWALLSSMRGIDIGFSLGFKTSGRTKPSVSELGISVGFGPGIEKDKALYIAPSFVDSGCLLTVDTGIYAPELPFCADGEKVTIPFGRELDYIVYHKRRDAIENPRARTALETGVQFSYEDLRQMGMF